MEKDSLDFWLSAILSSLGTIVIGLLVALSGASAWFVVAFGVLLLIASIYQFNQERKIYDEIKDETLKED